MRLLPLSLLTVALLVSGFGCTLQEKRLTPVVPETNQASTANSNATTVCALLYSGRPDDVCWELTDLEELELTTKIQVLEDTAWQKKLIPLGYHGLSVVLKPNGPLADGDFPVSINLFNGTISYTKDAKAMIDSRSYIDEPNPHFVYKSDPGRSVEKWLVATGKQEIPADTYTLMQEATEKKP